MPIYLEDCHAGSLYWLAQNLDLDQPYLLLHFDAHSDANSIFGSDNLRDALRQVPSVEERSRRLENWRKIGAVQCFDWIEPLMPRPIERVIWVPAESLTPADQAAREKDARGGPARHVLTWQPDFRFRRPRARLVAPRGTAGGHARPARPDTPHAGDPGWRS